MTKGAKQGVVTGVDFFIDIAIINKTYQVQLHWDQKIQVRSGKPVDLSAAEHKNPIRLL
jgi:hypothetical protein